MTSTKNEILEFLQHQITCMENTKSDLDVLSKITDTLIQARDNGNTVFVMGNGQFRDSHLLFGNGCSCLSTAQLVHKKREAGPPIALW